jgi:hypothetical protein
MKSAASTVSDLELAVRAAKLWPHREHEANSMLGLLCHVGIHRWRRLDLAALAPGKEILHCFWCSKVKVDGVVYEV